MLHYHKILLNLNHTLTTLPHQTSYNKSSIDITLCCVSLIATITHQTIPHNYITLTYRENKIKNTSQISTKPAIDSSNRKQIYSFIESNTINTMIDNIANTFSNNNFKGVKTTYIL